MSWIKSDAIAMYPSQGRSDYYNRKARYVSEANVTVSASALTSKHGFVINGLVPSEVGSSWQLSAGSFWIRGYVFTVASNISIEEGSNTGDVLCAVLRTDENGLRVGIADRIINQNDGTYELDKLDAKKESAFYGIQIVTKKSGDWEGLIPEHEECRYKSVSVTSGNYSVNYTEFYLRLAIWDGSAWKQPKNDTNDNVALNGLKIDASAISVTMPKTQSGAAAQDDYTATQDLATLLNKNFIIDDDVTGDNGHIRVRKLTTSNLGTKLVDRQPAIVRKLGVPYLFVGDGMTVLSDMQPITARTVEGWTADEGGLTATETTHYKISGVGGLKLECNGANIVLNKTITASSLSVTGATTLTGALTAKKGISATGSVSATVNVSADGNVTGKIGTLPTVTTWVKINATDKIAMGFARTNWAIENLQSFTTTGKIENDQDLNNYYGTSYWGKRYYAPGTNTVKNMPAEGEGSGFHLEVLRNGGSTTTQRITIYARGSGAAGSYPTVYVRGLTGGSGTQWSEWQEIAEAKGSYPDMTVGNYDTSKGSIKDEFDAIDDEFDDIDTKIAAINTKFTNLGTQPITTKEKFGGTNQDVKTINDLVNVLDAIFKGTYTVSGTIKSKTGFYAVGGI